MPITIDPLQPATEEEMELMDGLLKKADKDKKNKIHKQVAEDRVKPKKLAHQTGKEEVDLVHGLRKSEKGKKWWVVQQELGKGSKNTTVKLLPYYYEQNEQGIYQIHKAESENVLKVISVKDKKNMQNVLAVIKKECKQLEQYDENAELFVDRDNNKIYLKSTKAEGTSLDIYLRDHPNLTLSERLMLIDSIIKAAQILHGKNVYHLDLKLENIFYDEKSGKITFIDFGSSLNYSDKSGKITYLGSKDKVFAIVEVGSLWEVDPSMHSTTPFFDPINHDDNTPKQIDNYSLAGIFGCILSDWKVSEDQILKWDELPIFVTKNLTAAFLKLNEEGKIIKNDKGIGNMMRLAAAQNIDKKRYKFDELRSAYSDENDKKNLEVIIEALNKLGNEDKDKRVNLDDFSNELASLLPSNQKKNLKSSLEELMDLTSNVDFPDFNGNGKEEILNKGLPEIPDLEVPEEGVPKEEVPEEVPEEGVPKEEVPEEVPKEEVPKEQEVPKEEPKEELKEETKEEVPEQDMHKEYNKGLSEPKLPESTGDLTASRSSQQSNPTTPSSSDSETDLSSSSDSETDIDSLKVKSSKEDSTFSQLKRDNQQSASLFTKAGGDQPASSHREGLKIALQHYIDRVKSHTKNGEIDFTHGFWVRKESQEKNRQANYGLANKLLEELQTNMKIEEIFSETHIIDLRNQFKITRGMKDIRSNDLNYIIEAAGKPNEKIKIEKLEKIAVSSDLKPTIHLRKPKSSS